VYIFTDIITHIIDPDQAMSKMNPVTVYTLLFVDCKGYSL